MTDRELVEAAALAAGWKGWRSKHGYWNLEGPDGTEYVCCNGWPSYSAIDGSKLPDPTFGDALEEAGWLPLDDDGDALRLAVKLGLTLRTHGDRSVAISCERQLDAEYPHAGDPCKALRVAIVRVAAMVTP